MESILGQSSHTQLGCGGWLTLLLLVGGFLLWCRCDGDVTRNPFHDQAAYEQFKPNDR